MNDLTTEFPMSKSQPSEPNQRNGQTGVLSLSKDEGRSRLTGCVRRVEELTPIERDRMYAVFVQYFANVTRPRFEHDLAEKKWVILLADTASGEIQGFSTLMWLRTVVDDQLVVAFFSSDTIIQREYWGEAVLPRLWGKHVLGLAASIRDARVYWFLISSGYKTYRYLPLFFRVADR